MSYQINYWTVICTYVSDTERTHKMYLSIEYKLHTKLLFILIIIMMTMMILKTNNSSNIYGFLFWVNAMLKAICNKYFGAVIGYHEQQVKLVKVQFYHNNLFMPKEKIRVGLFGGRMTMNWHIMVTYGVDGSNNFLSQEVKFKLIIV